MIDTHTHIYLPEYVNPVVAVQYAKQVGITKLLLPNVDMDTIEPLHKFCDLHPDLCLPAMGLHPTAVGPFWKDDLKTIRAWFDQRQYIAIGEIGIDLYWDATCIKEQKLAFIEQLQWSLELDLPVIIHTREAYPEVFECLDTVGRDQLRGVFHSFGGTQEELEKILQYPNFLIGINGIVTFKNSKIRDFLPVAPIERIVTETDSPYLTPTPLRGLRNEPGYMTYVVKKLSQVYDLPFEEIEQHTTENAKQLFKIDLKFNH